MATLIWGENHDGAKVPAVVATVKECEAAWPHDRHEWFGLDYETDLTAHGIHDDTPVLVVCTRQGNSVYYWDNDHGSIFVDWNNGDGLEIIREFGIEIAEPDIPDVSPAYMPMLADGWPS